MSTVLALAGKINSGKSTIGGIYAKVYNCPYVSFGEYVRYITRQRDLPDIRENWQKIGEELVETDANLFCRAVLAQADWKPGQPLVIDGIRHAKISNLLKEIVAPSRYILTLIEVDEHIRQERLHREGVDQSDLIERIESHSTESQVKTLIPQIADFIINGNEPLPQLIERLRIISSNDPNERNIPVENLRLVSTMNTIHRMSPPEQREILGRLLSEQANKKSNNAWKSIRFGNSLRVVAYGPEQEQYIGHLRELLQKGVTARLENESDGTYEIYGSDRTYFVTMTPSREFAALLSSWELKNPPQEVMLQDGLNNG
jgi:dephospho-CoA kinase